MITVVTYILILVEAIVCFMLVGIILIQKTKSQGMGLAFGSGMGESLFGAQVGNVLTKTTVVLAIIFLVNTTLLAVIGAGRRSVSVVDTIKTTTVPSMPVSPMQEAPQAEPPIVDAFPPSMSDAPVAEMPADVPAPAAEMPAATPPVAAPEADTPPVPAAQQ